MKFIVQQKIVKKPPVSCGLTLDGFIFRTTLSILLDVCVLNLIHYFWTLIYKSSLERKQFYTDNWDKLKTNSLVDILGCSYLIEKHQTVKHAHGAIFVRTIAPRALK